MTSDLLTEAARAAILSLRETECIGTVTVDGEAWDVYVHWLPPGAFSRLRARTRQACADAMTVAVRLEEGQAVVGLFVPGALTLDEARRELTRAAN